jgi:hypothetical protein
MSNALTMVRSPGRWRALSATGAAVVAAGVVLSGCTGQRTAEAPPTPTSTTPASLAPPETPETPEPVRIEFEFRRPDPLCPSVAALEALPLVDQYPYALVDPFLSDARTERFGYFDVYCDYQRAEIGDGDDMILEDHARIGANFALYPRWEDSAHADFYPALPVQSADLDDWQAAATFRRERDWWEGCGEGTLCAEGEEPTVQTLAWQRDFLGHVGNLEFDVTVTYIAQRLPADVELRTVEIFRDLVLATMESYERVD